MSPRPDHSLQATQGRLLVRSGFDPGTLWPWLSSWLLLVSALFLTQPCLGLSVHPSQLPAMTSLAQAFPVKGVTDTWLSTLPCEQWVGVNCTSSPETGLISSISIDTSEVSSPGLLPSNIGELSALTSLEIAGGGVTGSLPASFSGLLNLQALVLTGSSLSGPLSAIPFSSLPSLHVLALNGNNFSGSLPASLSSCTSLELLLIGQGNRLSGTIPDIFQPLTALVALDLSGNHLHGPTPLSIASPPALAFLDLSNNMLSGPPPTDFHSRVIGTALGTYKVSNNFFSGSPVPFFLGPGGRTPFCPMLLESGFALQHLTPFGVAALSSTQGNCLDASSDSWALFNSQNSANRSKASLPVERVGEGSSAVVAAEVARNAWQTGGSAFGPAWKQQAEHLKGMYRSGQLSLLLRGPWGRGRGARKKQGAVMGDKRLDQDQGDFCFVEPQKPPQLCVSFCNALSPSGPCAGLGVCQSESPTAFLPKCECRAPAVNTLLESTGQPGISTGIAAAVPRFSSCTLERGTSPSLSEEEQHPPALHQTTPVENFSLGLNAALLLGVPSGLGSSHSWQGGGSSSQLIRSATQRDAPRRSLIPKPNTAAVRLNTHFRHFSLGFTGSYASPSWEVPSSQDWRISKGTIPGAVQSIEDQGACAASWVFSAAAAVESALAITRGSAPPNISEDRLLGTPGPWDCTSGGLPSDALDLLAQPEAAAAALEPIQLHSNEQQTNLPVGRGGRQLRVMGRSAREQRELLEKAETWPLKLETEVMLPLAEESHSKDKETVPAQVPLVLLYEETPVQGWLGLLLAVQAQPAIANVAAHAPSFQHYPGGYVYQDPACFADQTLSHSVLVVGYQLSAPVPFWVLRNSWGSSWGEQGYMRLAISGGLGFCGINHSPALIPVVHSPNPCAPINPCGGGTCTPNTNNQAYNCSQCPSNFMVVHNIDGSQTCGPVLVCNLFAFNPCGVGTCVDDQSGGYNCLCPPPSFVLKTLGNGAPTCHPGNASSTVLVQPGFTCDLIRTTYALSLEDFSKNNPGLACDSLTPGDVVNVANTQYAGCQIYYSVSEGDTCPSIESLFDVSLAILNPDLNCIDLAIGQQVCVQLGNPISFRCTAFYDVMPGDTCSNIALTTASPPLTPQLFYALNPGIVCSNLIPTATASRMSAQNGLSSSIFASSSQQQVCLQADSLAALFERFSCAGLTYTVQMGDMCSSILKWFGNQSCFVKYNGRACNDLKPGDVICRPKNCDNKGCCVGCCKSVARQS